MMLGNGVDYYEVLQVSRRADTDTIRRVYHLMAQRYHPDNRETGNDELFRQIVQANEVLCDPARRAAFDIQLASHDQARLHLFENWQSSRGYSRRSLSARQFCGCSTTSASRTPISRESYCVTLKT